MNIIRKKFYALKFSLILKPVCSLILIFVCAVIIGLSIGKLDYRYWFANLGIILFYFNYRIRVMSFTFNITSEFNKRFSELNDKLKVIDNSIGNKAAIEDYVNLCAEEYYLYQNGFLPLDVWNSWFFGMKYYFSIPNVKEYVLVEFSKSSKSKNSYYGFDPFKLKLISDRGDF